MENVKDAKGITIGTWVQVVKDFPRDNGNTWPRRLKGEKGVVESDMGPAGLSQHGRIWLVRFEVCMNGWEQPQIVRCRFLTSELEVVQTMVTLNIANLRSEIGRAMTTARDQKKEGAWTADFSDGFIYACENTINILAAIEREAKSNG